VPSAGWLLYVFVAVGWSWRPHWVRIPRSYPPGSPVLKVRAWWQ